MLTAAIKEDVGEDEGDQGEIDGVSKSGSASELFGGRQGSQTVGGEGGVEARRGGTPTYEAARYLKGAKTATVVGSSNPEAVRNIVVHVDSDWWVGCKTSRKSTSGGMLIVGEVPVKSWSSTQATEVEQKALVRGAAEALGLKAVLDELGWEMPIDIMIDSAAAKSMGCPLGLGKQRLLWVQEAVRRHRFSIIKILGTTKPRGYSDKAEANRHSGSAGWCRRLDRLAEVTGRKFCPEQLCAHVPGGPTQRGQAVGKREGEECWTDTSLLQSHCLMLVA